MEEKIKNIEEKILEMNVKVDAVYRSLEKLRKYFFWTLIITLVVVVGPLLLIPFLLPAFLSSLAIPTGF
jgi:hypothetical protein